MARPARVASIVSETGERVRLELRRIAAPWGKGYGYAWYQITQDGKATSCELSAKTAAQAVQFAVASWDYPGSPWQFRLGSGLAPRGAKL